MCQTYVRSILVRTTQKHIMVENERINTALAGGCLLNDLCIYYKVKDISFSSKRIFNSAVNMKSM